MAEFFNYTETLKAVCKDVNPSRVCEWGPGESTRIIHDVCPDASILTIEHDRPWFEKAAGLYGSFSEVRYANFENYFDINGKFDLFFVDGRMRVRCLMAAFSHLNINGAIILHDAERGIYQPGISALTTLGLVVSGTQTTKVFK